MGFRMARVVLASVLGDLALLCSQEGKHNPTSQPHPTQTSSFRRKACVSSRPQFLLLMASWVVKSMEGLGNLTWKSVPGGCVCLSETW